MKKQICLNCNKEFVSIKTRKYCSRKCINHYNYTKSKKIQNEDNIIILICANCGKEFEYKVETNYKKYCSLTCFQKEQNRRKKYKGIDNIHTFNVDKFNKRLTNKIKRNKYLKNEGLL